MASFIINKKKKYKFNVEVCLEELLEVPFVAAVLFAKLRHDASNFVGHSPRADVLDHKVTWKAQFSFQCKMSANASTGVLDRCVLRISVRKECKGGRSFTKLGFVDLNLAEYAGSVVPSKKALLEGYDTRHRLDNSMLKFSIKVHLLSGDTIFKVPSPSLISEEVSAEDNNTDNRLLDDFSSNSLGGSIASGSSGFGSLPKKRPQLLQSELVICGTHPPHPTTNTTSSEGGNLVIEDQYLSSNHQQQQQQLGPAADGGQLHLEHLETTSCEQPGHSRNSSNTSQMSKASGYSSGFNSHSRQSSSGDSGHIRNPSSGSLVVSETGSLDRAVKVSSSVQAQSVAPIRRKHPSSSTAEETDCLPAGRVEGTRVDVDDFISELLTQTNLNPIDDSNENSGLQLFIAKDGTAALGNHEVKSAGIFKQVFVEDNR